MLTSTRTRLIIIRLTTKIVLSVYGYFYHYLFSIIYLCFSFRVSKNWNQDHCCLPINCAALTFNWNIPTNKKSFTRARWIFTWLRRLAWIVPKRTKTRTTRHKIILIWQTTTRGTWKIKETTKTYWNWNIIEFLILSSILKRQPVKHNNIHTSERNCLRSLLLAFSGPLGRCNLSEIRLTSLNFSLNT